MRLVNRAEIAYPIKCKKESLVGVFSRALSTRAEVLQWDPTGQRDALESSQIKYQFQLKTRKM
jgi:hypothetical protein